jgi:hypothetical protein
LVSDLAAINPVLQHEIECATRQSLAAIFGADWADPPLAPYARRCKVIRQCANRLERKIATIDVDNRVSLGIVDDELAILHIVAERRHYGGRERAARQSHELKRSSVR